MTVCIDLCALTPPVCGLSFISIKFCSVLFYSGTLTPTASTAIRLWKTFTLFLPSPFTISIYLHYHLHLLTFDLCVGGIFNPS